MQTWHNYQSNPERPFNSNGKPNMMTEWADVSCVALRTHNLADTVNLGDWQVECLLGCDRSTCVRKPPSHMYPYVGTDCCSEGFQWALYMHNAFVNSETSGYTHWWCAQNTTGDNALIRLEYDNYYVSARLWAFASYFRFARPGAVRIEASSSAENLYVSAYINTNGTIAIPVINEAHFPYELSIHLTGINATMATAYLTNNEHNVTMTGQTQIGRTFMATIEPRAMKTFFLS